MFEMSDNKSQIALEVNDITKVFATKAGIIEALRGISFVINRGEFVSIVGPSGSGKSTLLNIIGALDRPTSGKVYIDGIDIFSLRDGDIAAMRNKLIGFIFQSFNLINRSTVQKNVELPAIISDMRKQERKRRALLLLESLGVADKARLKTSSLSGGQQQRVAIARALINNPTMVLADEPTGNLDTKTGNEVFDLLRILSNKFRRNVIFVTHNQELAKKTDRIIYIKDGVIEREVLN
jgi:putative ABC transport system ATP-binding protein